MEIKFGDLSREYKEIQQEIDEGVARVLKRGWFVLGPEVETFERNFAAYLGCKYCVGVASGTEAIALSLMACGIGAGDEVVTVAHTFPGLVSAISMVGAHPVFVDISPDTYLMDVSQVEASISPRTRAFLPVHLYGQCVDMEPLKFLAVKYGIPIIEDCAQAHGATYKGEKAGTVGLLGAFSFYPSKNLGCYGDGGAVVTNDAALAEKLRMLRNYGQRNRYDHETSGFNSRLDEIQAAILNVKLPHLDEWNNRRRELAQRYSQALSEIDSILPPIEKDYTRHIYHLYVVQTKDRNALQGFLSQNGLQTLIHYPRPIHLQLACAHLKYVKGSLPITESIADRIVSLPLFPQLAHTEIEYIISVIQEYFQTAHQVIRRTHHYV